MKRAAHRAIRQAARQTGYVRDISMINHLKTRSQLDFEAERLTGIGASSLPAMYNLDWNCGRREQYRLREVPMDFPKELKNELRRGKALEPALRKEYEFQTGRSIYEDSYDQLFRHPKHPWMIAHVDGIIRSVEGKDGPGVFEGKVLGQFPFKKQTREGLRESYIVQMQASLAATELKWGSFGLLWPDGWDLLWFDVDRDDEMIEKIIEDGELFWARIQNGPWLNALDPLDTRCRTCPWRRTCQGELLAMTADAPKDEGPLQEDPSLIPFVHEYQEAQQLVAEATGIKDEAHAAIVAALGSRQAVQAGDAKIYYREYPTERWDTAALNATMADPLFKALMAKYKKTGTQRPLRIYGEV